MLGSSVITFWGQRGDLPQSQGWVRRSLDLSFFFFIFWPCRPASGILVPFALEARSLNHWTTMQVPAPGFLMTKIHFPPCERIRNRKEAGKHCLLRAITPSSLGGSYRLPFRAPAWPSCPETARGQACSQTRAAPLATLSAHPTSAATSPSTEPGQGDTSVVRTPGVFQTLCRHLLMNSVLFLVKMALKGPRNFPSSSFPCTRLLPRKSPLVLNLKTRGLEPESLQVGRDLKKTDSCTQWVCGRKLSPAWEGEVCRVKDHRTGIGRLP